MFDFYIPVIIYDKSFNVINIVVDMQLWGRRIINLQRIRNIKWPIEA
jgi:hypothetical protein